VETPEQAEMLRKFGCPQVQGFLYGHPESAKTTSKPRKRAKTKPKAKAKAKAKAKPRRPAKTARATKTTPPRPGAGAGAPAPPESLSRSIIGRFAEQRT
jgi:hypothetical protein